MAAKGAVKKEFPMMPVSMLPYVGTNRRGLGAKDTMPVLLPVRRGSRQYGENGQGSVFPQKGDVVKEDNSA